MVKIIKSALRGERGSALLLSLMVMVGLSLLGLGFVAIAETENAISLNQRNTAQTAAVAEAGARAVVEWFQKPEWSGPAVDGGVVGIMPAKTPFGSDDPFKQDRMIDPDGSGPTAVQNEGEYKDQDDDLFFCCDRPFKPAINDRYYGSEQAPDILIAEDSGGPGTTFLNTFNTLLFGPDAGFGGVGRVVEIRLFAPPILDGNLNASNFWDHNVGTRYGLATIHVTAEKRTQTGQPFARRSVRIVLSEWPFPGPQGPIQSNANIQTGGNVAVHWGKMTAQGTMFVKRPLMGIPWYNPYDRMHIEHGYDSSNQWAPLPRVYYPGDIIHDAGNPNEPWVKTGPLGPTGSVLPPPFPAPGTSTPGDPMTDGVTTWVRRIKTKYPNLNTSTYDQGDYLFELLYDGTAAKEFDDPWIEARSRGAITNSNVDPAFAGIPHPFKYLNATSDETGDPTAGFSNWFQLQNVNDMAADKKEVIFPRIDYEFWKNTAISGQGNEGVYYLTWVAGENYRDNAGVVRNFAQWTNIVTGRPRGFYFFETTNNQNPQIPGGTAFLAPGVNVNSSDDGNEWTMSGFIYLNTVSFGTQGISGQDNRFNFPGEPYRDLGYWEATTGPPYTLVENPAASGNYVLKGNGSARWDYQDVNLNGKFDLFLELRTVTRPGDGTAINVWLPVPFFNNCTPGMNGDPGADCSEPHEPYVNLLYPVNACCGGGGAPNAIMFGWEDPNGAISRRPKKRINSTTWPTVDASDNCTDPTQFDVYCTSNRHDRDGYADEWTGAGDAPVLDGVFYCEGDFDPTGNARYFGSLLINGNVDSTGTNEVWFDERLIKDEWPPREWPFPRVIITAVETN